MTNTAATERCHCTSCVTERMLVVTRNAARGVFPMRPLEVLADAEDIAAGHAEDWHRACESEDGCDRTVCLDPLLDVHAGAYVTVCLHGRALCDRHGDECPECAVERRTDARF